MKLSFKLLVLTVSLFSLSFIANAQAYIGGSISYTKSSKDVSFDGYPNFTRNQTAVFLNPEIGFHVNEKWVIGGRISYRHDSYETFAKNQRSSRKVEGERSSDFTFIPYSAYKALQFGDFAVWGELSAHISKQFKLVMQPVLTYNINEHFLLRTEMNFAGLYWARDSKTNESTFSFTAGGEDALSFGDLTIGIVYRF